MDHLCFFQTWTNRQNLIFDSRVRNRSSRSLGPVLLKDTERTTPSDSSAEHVLTGVAEDDGKPALMADLPIFGNSSRRKVLLQSIKFDLTAPFATLQIKLHVMQNCQKRNDHEIK